MWSCASSVPSASTRLLLGSGEPSPVSSAAPTVAAVVTGVEATRTEAVIASIGISAASAAETKSAVTERNPERLGIEFALLFPIDALNVTAS